MTAEFLEGVRVRLLNAARCDLDSSWNYQEVVSPFSRIYLITDGEGQISPDNQLMQLKKGYMYLIPSYVHCSYSCDENLSQNYLHFTNELQEGLKIFDILHVTHEIKAKPIDYLLFDRLLEINDDAELVQSDPQYYQKKDWISHRDNNGSPASMLETNGIVKQLLSRFITEGDAAVGNVLRMSRMRQVFNYIGTHLNDEIRMEKLAEIACYSTDHFTRQFKQTTGLLPVEYINKKRIEKAQLMLMTTSRSQREISEQTGFSCQQYYSRVFKKLVGCSPAQYRKQGEII